MPRYIDAERLCELARNHINKSIDCNDIMRFPLADVQEVRHGYWIPSPDGINPIICSECNMPAPFVAGENEFGDFDFCRYPSKYCHGCGARMDKEK